MLAKKLESAAKAVEPVYVEDVFQTWLSTGNGTSRTVTGPDMTLGGLSITKSRSAATGWRWVDTARGAGLSLESNSTAAQATESTGVTAFTTTGTSIGSDADYNTNGATYVDYLLKKQPKFFDVVTYTGNGTSNRPVAHSLASVPGCIIIKSMGTVTNWMVWHRSLSTDNLLTLNSTAAQANYATLTIHDVTSTNFQVDNYSMLNASGVQYVAYLFAHDAGGFGLTGTDNVISCGSYTGNGSATGPTINLGYEPQWLMIKLSSGGSGGWVMFDNLRGWPVGSGDAYMYANTSGVEQTGYNGVDPTATGFRITHATDVEVNASGSTYIYIAIRRGPMKTPTSGTSVFAPANASGSSVSTNFPVDMFIKTKKTTGAEKFVGSRLFGPNLVLQTQSAVAEISSGTTSWDSNTALVTTLESSFTCASWIFRRAPGFFDVVCYTGTGVARTVNHNLGVAPELMIVKERNSTGGWKVYSAITGAGQILFLNSDAAPVADASFYTWNNTAPTSSVFSLGIAGDANQSGATYVAYLFASCPGVSKIGTFTYPGTSTVDCGFSSGARFVMLKRTSTSGGWLVFDTARGIVSGNDPYLELQSTNAEVTTGDVIDPNSSGFAIGSLSNGTYIFLAIA